MRHPALCTRIYTPAMRIQVAFAVLILALSSSFAASQQATDHKPATVAEAQAFVDRANAELLKLGNEASHADWTSKTNITEDTEATKALLTEQLNARNLELIAESQRLDHLD